MASWEDVTTYEQLQAMTPQERADHFRASMVLDPAELALNERDRVAAMSARLDERAQVREEHLRGRAS